MPDAEDAARLAEIQDRLAGLPSRPWLVDRMRHTQRITNGEAVVIAEVLEDPTYGDFANIVGVESLAASIAALPADLAYLIEALDDSKAAVAETDRMFDSIIKQRDDALAELAVTKDALSLKQAEAQGAWADYDAAKSEGNRLLAELAKAQQETAGFSAINNRWAIAYEALDALRAALEAELAKAQQEVDRLTNRAEGAEATWEAIAQYRDELRAEVTSLRAALEGLPEQIAQAIDADADPSDDPVWSNARDRAVEAARSFAASRPTPAPEMARSVFPAPHYGRTVPLDDTRRATESGAGE